MVVALRDQGHEVLLLRDHLPIRSVDPLVIAKAQELDCLLLSLNGDFSDIVTYPPARYGGILALQLHNHPETIPPLVAHLGRYLDSQTDRDFFRAGAETVLASHWKVNDEATSRLMTEFMRRWRAGEPRAKAWREAQLSLMRSKDYSNPYYWAAFTLTGQWR